MQTFLPFADFERTASVLDRQRLGSQRRESLQILRTLAGINRGWQHLPVVRMWRGHERVLIRYSLAICSAWVGKGYKDTCMEKIAALKSRFPARAGRAPGWLGVEEIHASHRALLLKRNPAWYQQFGWSELPGEITYPEGE